ncbi:hypothetical protein GCM10010211_68680 [Streptomyces albospinus]|uniref:Uncharacterized protein n=1 Tax=Streptomyces albospinus TaxID=285515 RepID=A0ABQ2VJV8_9ACTN|nr:hypothetical protein GCM10010211_68680 [Streptomyces albospinus]
MKETTGSASAHHGSAFRRLAAFAADGRWNAADMAVSIALRRTARPRTAVRPPRCAVYFETTDLRRPFLSGKPPTQP